MKLKPYTGREKRRLKRLAHRSRSLWSAAPFTHQAEEALERLTEAMGETETFVLRACA